MKKMIKTTLVSCIIASMATFGAANASAACLAQGLLQNIVSGNSGTNVLGSLISGNSNCTAGSNCGSNVLGSLISGNSNCTAGSNCGSNVLGSLISGNSNCTTGDCVSGSENCGSGVAGAGNTAKATITTSKAAVITRVNAAQTVKVSAKNVKELGISTSSSCVKAAISSSLKNGKATVKLTGVCKGTASVKIYSKEQPSVSRTVTVIVSGNASCSTGTANTSNVTGNTQTNTNTNVTASQSTGYAEEVLKYVNEARKANGLGALKLNTTLNAAAEIRAKEIIKSFSHTRPDGRPCFTAFAEVGYTYRSAGENIAYGYSSAKSVVNAWLASPGHRANILSSKYTYMGLAKNGTRWAQLFAG